MRSSSVILLIAAAMVLSAVVVIQAQNPGKVRDNPVQVGLSKGGEGPTPPGSPTTTRGRTTASGALIMDLNNASPLSASDVHIRVDSPRGAKVSSVNFPGGQFAVHNQQGLPAATAEGRIPAGGNPVPPGTVVPVDIVVVDKDDNPLEQQQVSLSIWWSRGPNFDIWVSATSGNRIGNAAPLTTLASLNITNYNVSPVQVLKGTNQPVDVNLIVLAECHDFRFQEGCLVVSAEGTPTFIIDEDKTHIEAWDEQGNQVVSQSRVSFSNLRIDDFGNFVFNIERDRTDQHHIVIVIRGLKITNLEGVLADWSVPVSFGGAALGGGCIHSLYDIVTIFD
jgi:hypothetical protein